jgi:hypothetical protein
MLRLSILSSVIPLVLVGGAAHDWTAVPARNCFAAATADPSFRSVAFTADPLAATVKVQIVDSAELADLAIVDDAEAADASACGLHDAARLVTAQPRPGDPIVHLTREADADYRIYVDSRKISPEQAAAIIVGARGGQMRLAAHPVDTEPTGSVSR